MRAIIAKRYPLWERILGESQLDDLALSSGGNLRDYFRLLRETLIGPITLGEAEDSAPRVTTEIIDQAKNQLRNELLPIPREDGRWLQLIHESKRTMLEKEAEIPRLTRFLDSNLIMNYLNGEPWYDIHPLLQDEVAQYATGD